MRWTQGIGQGLMIALAFCAPAAAQEKVIRFGLTGDYPPFAERLSDGSYAGADVVIARRIAQGMGARAEFVLTGWTRLSEDFAAGRFDVAIGGLTVLPDRAALGTFSIPLMDDGKRPLALCRDKGRYRSIAAIDRPGVRVQINRGPAIAALAKQWFRQASVTVNPDDATLTDRLLNGQADVWITDGVVVDHMARLHRGKLCATTREPFTHLTKAWLIRNDPALIAGINAGLARALKDGSWQKALRAVR
ncbi:MAG TPA: transporter substrate-binding domain-containing protein [Sphingobium sp.]